MATSNELFTESQAANEPEYDPRLQAYVMKSKKVQAEQEAEEQRKQWPPWKQKKLAKQRQSHKEKRTWRCVECRLEWHGTGNYRKAQLHHSTTGHHITTGAKRP